MPTIQEALDDLVANTTGLQNTVSGRITDMDGKITQANSAQVAAETAKINAEIAETSAQTAQTLAETARDIASTAKVDAQTAKSDALTAQSAATSAQGSAEAARDASIAADVSASTHKTDSQTAKNAAVTAQGNAETAETNAAASASAANSHKTKAGQWADAAEDASVETGKYSAKHWSAKAAIENTAAGVSEVNASTSASTATTKAATATTKAAESLSSANASASSASTASGHKDTATTKASEAVSSASTASTKAATATTKAAESVVSATASNTSATASEVSNVAAGVSASTATSKAATATTKASEASGSASTASTKATEASSSASSASGSASTATSKAATATTKASEASSSATAASGSASIATTKASEASSSASSAATAATNAVNAVIDTAPANLNTLNELAAALGDDANFAGTVTTSLGNRYTKTETDAKIVALSPPTDITSKFDKTGGTITGHVVADKSIKLGQNLARVFGSIHSSSTQHSASRSPDDIINGTINYENGEDWLTAAGQRDNAWVIIDLGVSRSVSRAVIYNQNEYGDSHREVKNFTLEYSADLSTWNTAVDSDMGQSHGQEPNPGWSFKFPTLSDDQEGNHVGGRYWRFTMKTFHGSDSHGGITELELYNDDNQDTEINAASLNVARIHGETGEFSSSVRIGWDPRSANKAGPGTLRYNLGTLEMSDENGVWAKFTSLSGWKYESMPTKGIVMGGYKDSVSWYTVNKATYSTDTTSNIGDIMDHTLVYNPGMPSKTHSYGIGMNDTTDNSANTPDVARIAHSTETYTWDGSVMPRSRNHADTIIDDAQQIGYVQSGGSTRIDKCVYSTNTWYDQGTDGYTSETGGTGSCHNGTVGHLYGRNSTYLEFNFANGTPSNLGALVVTTLDRAKGMVVDENYAWYFGGLGTSDYLHQKVGYSTHTSVRTGSYPGTMGGSYYGETNNCAMPQNSENYVLGGYGGSTGQNNTSGKFNSSTEVTLRISSLDMIGHLGASSGGSNWGS